MSERVCRICGHAPRLHNWSGSFCVGRTKSGDTCPCTLSDEQAREDSIPTTKEDG